MIYNASQMSKTEKEKKFANKKKKNLVYTLSWTIGDARFCQISFFLKVGGPRSSMFACREGVVCARLRYSRTVSSAPCCS